ncbi:hypothetical protein OH710_17425 [Pseudomonas capsici]|uniref:hypothetical protein n=1 Tax=Pseudomonas capsici TaxID=2810614 RepID=UPI0019E47FCE|nr:MULTISPECIES: hypothetical protein [Pseudomonas]MCV4274422.1 hypothetical protein [Pseudomonas capsici]GFM55921.1 hypothetical protein PSCICF_20990 [Pseudomonas cichorii]GFM60164.1 hypothetical protein PSCICG_13240 [Pseudomonas cichorii]
MLKKYLSWCVTRYLPRARQNSATHADIDVVFADVADVIERRSESHIINARPDRTRYRSLTDTQLQIVRTLIRPGAAENPFPERLQLRNWLMIDMEDRMHRRHTSPSYFVSGDRDETYELLRSTPATALTFTVVGVQPGIRRTMVDERMSDLMAFCIGYARQGSAKAYWLVSE